MTHALTENSQGSVVSTQEWTARKVATLTNLTIDQSREALKAFYDIAWSLLIEGHRLRLGALGSVAVCARKGTTVTLVSAADGQEFTTATRPCIELRGRIGASFREAWYEENEENAEAYQEENEDGS